MPREPLNEGSDAKQTDLAEIPALLTTGHCYNTVLGSGTQRCSKGWGLTSRYKAADGQTRCTRQLPGREALLQEPMMIQPSSSQNGCQRHRATGSLWAAGPTQRGPGVCGRAAVGAEAGTGLLHTRAGADWCICSSSLLPFQCQGHYYSWPLHRPRKSPQHSSLSVPAKRQSL